MNTDESLSPGDVPVAGVARNSFKKRRMEFLCKTLQYSKSLQLPELPNFVPVALVSLRNLFVAGTSMFHRELAIA